MIDTNNLVLHGVGEAFLLSADGKATTRLSKLQSMSIELTSESEDVYGGDSLFPFFNYIKSKSANFKFKNATFDLNVLSATQGTEIEDGAEVNVTEDIKVTAHAGTLSHTTTNVDVDSVVVISKGKALKRVVGTPKTDEFAVTEAGKLTFETSFPDGNVTVSYIYKETNGSSVNVKTNSIPSFVELRHVSQPVKLKDGRTVQVHTRVYKAVCDGGFTLEYTRDGAVAPEVTFKSVDPERADKRFVSYSVVEVK